MQEQVRRRSKAWELLALVAWVALSFSASIPGVVWMPGDWYAGLNKPSWNPPNWVFGPVWTTLYLLMGVSAWRVWRRTDFTQGRGAIGWFLAQLALNATWTPVFFGLHEPGWALLVIVALCLAIVATMRAFRRHDRPAAALLIPYLAWVGFAAFLNGALWRLN